MVANHDLTLINPVANVGSLLQEQPMLFTFDKAFHLTKSAENVNWDATTKLLARVFYLA